MSLTLEDYNILRLIESKPTLSYTDIANILNISPATARRKILKLRERKLFTGKYAQYDPHALGLEKYVTLIRCPKSFNLPKVEDSLKAHPYTIHHSRIYTPYLGIYAQFYYPSKDPSYLKDFFDEIKKENLISDYELYSSQSIEKTLPLDLTKVSPDNLTWDFDWKNFLEKYKSFTPQPLLNPKENVIDNLKPLDFQILRLLTYNADMTQTELSKALNTDKTEVWRRYHYLEKHVIVDYKAKINRRIFNISANRVVFLKFSDKKELNKCFSIFSDESLRPPFRYSVEILSDQKEDYLAIYISLPQYHEAELFYFLNDIAETRSYQIDPIGDHGVRYSFYDPNYNYDKKKWELDKSYVLDIPIKKSLLRTLE